MVRLKGPVCCDRNDVREGRSTKLERVVYKEITRLRYERRQVMAFRGHFEKGGERVIDCRASPTLSYEGRVKDNILSFRCRIKECFDVT